MSDEAQPVEAAEAEGQGSEESSGLYDQYLSDIPSEFHDKIIDGFKAKDADFTRRFTALSEKWKPYDEHYEQLPQWMELSGALEQAQSGDKQSLEAVNEWWENLGETLGFYDEKKQQEASEDDDEFDPFDKNKIASLIQEQIEQAVNPLAQTLQSQQEAQSEAEAERILDERIEQLKSEHDELTDDDIQAIMELGVAHAEDADDPLQVGFERFQAIVSRGENNLFSKKASQPVRPEGPGAANTAPQEATLDNVKKLATEQLKAMASNA